MHINSTNLSLRVFWKDQSSNQKIILEQTSFLCTQISTLWTFCISDPDNLLHAHQQLPERSNWPQPGQHWRHNLSDANPSKSATPTGQNGEPRLRFEQPGNPSGGPDYSEGQISLRRSGGGGPRSPGHAMSKGSCRCERDADAWPDCPAGCTTGLDFRVGHNCYWCMWAGRGGLARRYCGRLREVFARLFQAGRCIRHVRVHHGFVQPWSRYRILSQHTESFDRSTEN